MNRPDPQSLTIDALVSDIDQGLTKIPQFQREFVWSREKSAKLIDSIIKGYPIGTFIVWQTKESLRSVREVGNLKLPQTPEGRFTQYVLDGQQRMTSVYACIKGAVLDRDDRKLSYYDIWIDLEAPSDGDVVLTSMPDDTVLRYIRIKDLFDGDFTLISQYASKLHPRMQSYRDQLKGFLFSTILIKDVGIEVATDVFTRINTTGKDLTLFEIMVAKTFSEQHKFDLLEKYEELQKRLVHAHFGSLPPLIMLQVVSAIIRKDCSTKSILGLPRAEFIDTWPLAVSALESAVDYARHQLRVPVSELLPFNPTIVILAYFFHLHKHSPSGQMQKLLNDLFWRISLGGRYSGSVETKMNQDLRRVDRIFSGGHPEYDWPVENSYEFITENGYFSASRSYIKALLCILVAQNPLSFDTNSIVNVKNDWLKRANSKNYHHFFPKGFLNKKEINPYANHIANITLVDDRLNKSQIGAKKPSKYLQELLVQNPDLKRTLMRNHLIDFDKDNLINDDYNTFFDNRVERLRKEIRKRIIAQPVDLKKQAPIGEVEETALESDLADEEETI